MGIVLISIIAVAIVTFVGLQTFFRRIKPDKSPTLNPLFWLSTILATPLVIAGCLFLWYAISSSYPQQVFDQAMWSENQQERYQYTDDLLDNEKLIGLTIDETIAILGEPENQEDSIMIYNIGYDPKVFLNGNPDWMNLVIKDEIVYSVSIER